MIRSSEVNTVLIKDVACTNRWHIDTNTLEIKLSPGIICKLTVNDSIQLTLRLSVSVDEFFGPDGATTFIDRLSAVLGIHASRIRMNSVYETGRRLSDESD